MGKQWKQCQTLFLGAPKSLQMVTAAMKLKKSCSYITGSQVLKSGFGTRWPLGSFAAALLATGVFEGEAPRPGPQEGVRPAEVLMATAGGQRGGSLAPVDALVHLLIFLL